MSERIYIWEPTAQLKFFNVNGKRILKQVFTTQAGKFEWREVEMEPDIETYDPLFNAYEAYENRFKVSQSPRKTTIYLTEGDIRYIYEKLEYKGILNRIDFELARAIEREVLRRNA
jgi:hypothetical protein